MAKIRLHEQLHFAVEWRRLPERDIKNSCFFRSAVAVHLSVSIRLCMQIEDVSTIFDIDNYFWIRSLVFALEAKDTFLGFLVPKFFFMINPSFMNRILPKLKH